MQILAILGACFIVWYMYTTIKRQPGAFNRTTLSKSLTTMGVLALILIAFIAFCVLLLRAG
jgi:hypothetical protein